MREPATDPAERSGAACVNPRRTPPNGAARAAGLEPAARRQTVPPYRSGTSNSATMLMILMSGLMAGPAVSL
jgi:hypothetical protein